MAERMEEAFAASSSYLLGFANDLVGEVQTRIRNAEPDARSVATGMDAQCASAIRQSFRLGQLSFAQVLASQMVLTRTDSAFLNEVYQPKYQRYLTALAQQELTNSDLAIVVRESPEHVSRKLNVLRRLGITDFRRESKNTVNFLTVAARDALQSKPLKKTRVKLRHGLDAAAIKRITAGAGKRSGTAPPARHLQKPIGNVLGRASEPSKVRTDVLPTVTAQERIRNGKVEEISKRLGERYRGNPTFEPGPLLRAA